jgi:hypothetical protein
VWAVWQSLIVRSEVGVAKVRVLRLSMYRHCRILLHMVDETEAHEACEQLYKLNLSLMRIVDD